MTNNINQLGPDEFNNDLEDDKIAVHYHPRHGYPVNGEWYPWYNDKEDFNTNAISYYEYLAHRNYHLKLITDLLNRVARRNITVKDTNSIHFIKNYDWISEDKCNNYHDIIELLAHVKRSSHEEVKQYTKDNFTFTTTLRNAILEFTDGIWVPDWTDLIDKIIERLDIEITERKEADKKLDDKINKEIEDRKAEDKKLDDKINNETKKLDDKINKETEERKKSDDEINKSITNLSKIVTSVGAQPPYQIIKADIKTQNYATYTNPPVDESAQGPSLKYAKLEYMENGKKHITTWLVPDFDQMELKNAPLGCNIAYYNLSKLRQIGIPEGMLTGIDHYNRVYTCLIGLTVAKIKLFFNQNGDQVVCSLMSFAGSNGSNTVSGSISILGSPWIYFEQEQ